ncbi:MAG: hypothetical protein UV34_C0002G0016 [Parcubacteria group bacterium GW2011_GWB1_42_6]|nr:MAG: hypothetical protein UV34_C0002G0016 [Parcubacteria group bacterium GW2011_GWB1_42_6]
MYVPGCRVELQSMVFQTTAVTTLATPADVKFETNIDETIYKIPLPPSPFRATERQVISLFEREKNM